MRRAKCFNPHRPFRAGATPPYIVALLMGRKEVLRGDPPLGTLAQGLGTECPNRFSSSTTAFAALREPPGVSARTWGSRIALIIG